MTTATLLIAIALALVHIFGARVLSLETAPRSHWLSVGAGITLAFVFLYLLPELDYFRRILAEHRQLRQIEALIYLVALAGVTLYYGLEHLAYRVRKHHHSTPSDEASFGHDYVFWLHMTWYALYNVIIGLLLLHGQQETVRGLGLFGAAMGIHFLTIDAAMRHHHRHIYRTTGRWVLATAVMVGWLIGLVAPLPTTVLALVTAFLVGAMLLNAIKDELPSSRKTRFVPFVLGATVATAILLMM